MVDVVTVVGVGADGWSGLAPDARAAVESADVVLGSRRQLDLVPVDVEKVAWPSPLLSHLDDVLSDHKGQTICVLASGDPLLSGIGTTLVNRLGADNVRTIPALSSVTLARARLGWSHEETAVVSAVGRSPQRIVRVLSPGRKVLALSADGTTPAALAKVLVDAGYGASRMTVLSDLGAPTEARVDATAQTWTGDAAPLNVVAVDCVATNTSPLLPLIPGLPDDAFEHDGQLSKRDIRASALARLAPTPGQLLWDVGAGAGTVAIEWLRAHETTRAKAFERRADRAERIRRNADKLGVPELDVIEGDVRNSLPHNEKPDAIFVGGAVSAPGILDDLRARLAPGGRLVAHAVTLESEQTLAAAYQAHGGELTRIAVEHAEGLGSFVGWRPARTVTQWSITA